MIVPAYRLTKFAFQNFFRNFWLSLVTITIIILSLFSLNTLLGITGLTNAVLASVSEQIDISIYFKTGVAEESILLVREQIQTIPEASQVNYVTAAQALEDFKRTHENDSLVTDALSELETNPLGAILLVRATSLSDYDTLLNKINSLTVGDLIEDIEFEDRRLIISKLNLISDRISLALTVTSALFLVIAIMVVFNTIRLGIYAHREEVAIMKLVGASNWFTRMPFVIEGFLYALFSVVLFWGIFFLLLSWADPFLVGFFSEINFSAKAYFLENILTYSWQQLVGLTLINTISSIIAIRRYLRI